MEINEMIKVLLAYKSGKTIEVKKSNGEWLEMKRPRWCFSIFEYRIKPEQDNDITESSGNIITHDDITKLADAYVADNKHIDADIETKMRNAFICGAMVGRDTNVSTTDKANMTWKDVKRIVNIADEVFDKVTRKELIEIGEEGYFKRVLEQLNSSK